MESALRATGVWTAPQPSHPPRPRRSEARGSSTTKSTTWSSTKGPSVSWGKGAATQRLERKTAEEAFRVAVRRYSFSGETIFRRLCHSGAAVGVPLDAREGVRAQGTRKRGSACKDRRGSRSRSRSTASTGPTSRFSTAEGGRTCWCSPSWRGAKDFVLYGQMRRGKTHVTTKLGIVATLTSYFAGF